MSYADSAIDYNWEVVNLSVGQRLMTVKYTADSSRPAVFLNHRVNYDQFNDSDLTAIATSLNTELRVVTEWDKLLEAQAANVGFNADSYIGSVYSGRYKVRTSDSAPVYNPLRFKATTTLVEDSYEIRSTFSVVAMNDSDKAAEYADLRINRNELWAGLVNSNYMSTVASGIGVDSQGYDSYSGIDVDFLTREVMVWDDSLSGSIQSIVGLNDSDWAQWIVDNALTDVPPPEPQ